jgi:Icc-related predicted phosphoesterase
VRIASFDENPFLEVACRGVDANLRQYAGVFPLHTATADRLPEGVDAVIAASDLQFREASPDANRLFGEAFAEDLAAMSELGELPAAGRVGIVLCGDLYVAPLLDARGGYGEVRGVWRAFADRFAWVIGVPGNHDRFGENAAEERAFCATPGVFRLDGDSKTVGGIRFAGLGGIIGKPTKPRRRERSDFLRTLKSLVDSRPDVLLLHQGPNVLDPRMPGDDDIRGVLERAGPLLVLCGHQHWKTARAELAPCVQVLNLEMRAAVFTRAASDRSRT